MKKEMMENATGVKLTKKASKNVIRSLSVGLAAMMALSTPIAAFAEDADGQNSSETTPEESTTTVTTQKSAADQVKEIQPVDMFPQTAHCENICLLTRNQESVLL